MHNRTNVVVLIVIMVFPAIFSAISARAQVSSDGPPRLIGTIEGGDFSGAVFDEAGGQKFYRIREKMPDGSQIIKVNTDSILVRRSDGSSYELFIARGKSSPQQPVSSVSAPPPAAPASAASPPPDMPRAADQPPPDILQPAGRDERNVPGSEGAAVSPRRHGRRPHSSSED